VLVAGDVLGDVRAGALDVAHLTGMVLLEKISKLANHLRTNPEHHLYTY
jgi:hypothetical protein